MKDINSSFGGGTADATEDTSGLIRGIVVRNKGTFGRRVGIFTTEPAVEVGSKIHAADYRMIAADATEDANAVGYQSGKSVELSAARNYQQIFNFTAPAPFHGIADNSEFVNPRMGSAMAMGIDNAVEYNPAETKNDFPTGVSNIPNEYMTRNCISFAISIANVLSFIHLDVNKHPALLTADLNYQLANINHNLRGIVSVGARSEFDPRFKADWYIDLAVPVGLTVTIPPMNVVTEVPEWNEETYKVSMTPFSLGAFRTTHLNNDLNMAMIVTRDSIDSVEMPTVIDPNASKAVSVSTLIAEMTKPTDLTNTESMLKFALMLTADKFKVLEHDHRYSVALIDITRSYEAGDFTMLDGVYYVRGGARTPAELLVVERNASNYYVGSTLIDVERSLAENRLVGFTDENTTDSDSEQALAENGGENTNADINFKGRVAIAVIVPEDAYNRFTPMYRKATGPVTVEVELRTDVTPRPMIAMEDRVFEWGKEDSDRLPIKVNFEYPEDVNFTIEKAIAVHPSGTIEEAYPEISVDGTQHSFTFVDGYSRRELTFGRTAGSIDFALVGRRRALNDSAETMVRWIGSDDYTVTLPDVFGKVDIDPIGAFKLAVDSNERLTFNGTLTKVDGATADSFYPMYYTTAVKATAYVNNSEELGQNGTVTVPLNVGVNSAGAFTFSDTVGSLSTLAEGVHTLRVALELTYYWGSKATFEGEVEFKILPVIEGIEDDVTFITANSYDARTESVVETPVRIIDLDTGDVLAEAETIQDLMVDADTRGFVSVDMIYGDPIPSAPSQISCAGALPEVELELSGEYFLEINGINLGGPYDLQGLHDAAIRHDVLFQIGTLPTLDTVVVSNPGFSFNGTGEAQIRIGKTAMFDWSGQETADQLKADYDLVVEEISTQSDPYDPYSVVTSIMFKHISGGILDVEVFLLNNPTVNPTPDNGEVNFAYSNTVYSMQLADYVPLYKAKALLHPDVRTWSNGVGSSSGYTVALNDPNLKMKYVIEDIYRGDLLPTGTSVELGDVGTVAYDPDAYLTVNPENFAPRGEFGFLSSSATVKGEFLSCYTYVADESYDITRIVSSAVLTPSMSVLINGEAHTATATGDVYVVDKTDIILQAGDFTLNLQLPVELAGYKLEGPWPFAHEVSTTVDEFGIASLTVTSAGMYVYREPFTFYVKLENRFGGSDFNMLAVSYGNPGANS